MGCNLCEKDEVIYYDSFGVEYVPKEIMERIENKNIKTKTSIFRIQDNNSVMCGYFCTVFIEYMLNNKTFTVILIFLVLEIFKKMMKSLRVIFNNGNNKFEYKVFLRRSK